MATTGTSERHDQPEGRAGSAFPFYARTFGLWFVIYFVVKRLPGFHGAGPTIASKHPLLLSAAITTTVLGFITGLGGVIALLLAEGHASSEADLARYGRRYRAARGSVVRMAYTGIHSRKQFTERSVDFEFTLSSVMAALRLKSWKTDAHWRRVFVLVAGSLATFIGGLALLLVLSRPEGRPTVIAWIAVVSVSLAVSFAR
jgi:hypothetical protein